MSVIQSQRQQLLSRYVAKISAQTMILLDEKCDLFAGDGATSASFMTSYETYLKGVLVELCTELKTESDKQRWSADRFG